MAGDKNGAEIVEINMTRNYFLMSEEKDMYFNEQHSFYKQQKYVTYLMASDFAISNRFHNHIKNAIELTVKEMVKPNQLY